MIGFGRLTIDAIVETGGKQYKVAPGQTLRIEKLDVATGATVEFDRVLLIADGSTAARPGQYFTK